MTTPARILDITVTQAQQRLVLSALHEKAVESDHYLRGYQVDETPGPLDVCCNAHLARYEERKVQRDALLARREQINTLIAVFQGTTPQPAATMPTTVGAEHITLVYLDEHGTAHHQPLSDVVSVGTLIDPGTGADLQISRAVVDVRAAEQGTWDNTITRELADALRDRGDRESREAAHWLAEHENDHEVWNLVGDLLDRLTCMANEPNSA